MTGIANEPTRRGALTAEIQTKAVEVLSWGDITLTELRLLPYIQYTMMNDQRLDPNKVSPEERVVLSQWRQRGWIEGGASGLSVSKHFWDGLNEILWLGYVTPAR